MSEPQYRHLRSVEGGRGGRGPRADRANGKPEPPTLRSYRPLRELHAQLVRALAGAECGDAEHAERSQNEPDADEPDAGEREGTPPTEGRHRVLGARLRARSRSEESVVRMCSRRSVARSPSRSRACAPRRRPSCPASLPDAWRNVRRTGFNRRTSCWPRLSSLRRNGPAGSGLRDGPTPATTTPGQRACKELGPTFRRGDTR